MIPHPLTLLYCWLIGAGLSGALGYVLRFSGEVFVDAERYGWIGGGSLAGGMLALGMIAAFASGLFIGAAMRLLAEKDWLKAAGWASLALLLSSLGSPYRVLAGVPGCFLGAYLCGRSREERWLEGAEELLRSWMFWEPGGAL